MTSSIPIENKKARGLAAQNAKEPMQIETDEFVEEFHAIEANLKQSVLGNIKLFLKNMTFE